MATSEPLDFDTAFGPNGLIMLVPMARVVELTNRRGKVIQPERPAHVRLCGPTFGHACVSDPDVLRFEAARLCAAADALEQVNERVVS